MSSNSQEVDLSRGWLKATLHCFKSYKLDNKFLVSKVISDLVSLPIDREIHMQVTPKAIELEVEIVLIYSHKHEDKVRDLMVEIDNIFANASNEAY